MAMAQESSYRKCHCQAMSSKRPNQALEPTPNSFRSCVAPAIGRGSPRTLALTKNIPILRAMRAIPETDWKKLRALKTRALNDACARILDAVAQTVQNSDGREHEVYLALWELIHEQDDVIASMFDDFKRSTAFSKLAAWQRHGLVTERDMALFTEETQATVKAINQ
jgi:hypothetical protein